MRSSLASQRLTVGPRREWSVRLCTERKTGNPITDPRIARAARN
jgi:hypothetical protein